MPDKYTVTGLLLVSGSVLFILAKGFIINVHQITAGEFLDRQEVTAPADTLRCRYLTLHGFEDRNYWLPPAGQGADIPCPLFLHD
jgi:hypothetical protein